MAVKARIPVEFYFDEQLETWHFHVDEPRVVGGGQKTIERAREAASKAIAFALEGTQAPIHGGKIEYLDIAVGP